jgi:hypothetical protein
VTSIDICFDPVGTVDRASSRLRAWRIAKGLRSLGLVARVGGDPGRTIHVFQKCRDGQRLAKANQAGALTVFDLDDNILLSERGQRHQTLAFMNLVEVVTVGSHQLRESVSHLHPRVRFVENPVDIAPDAPLRPVRPWKGALCWFGSPENIMALDALRLTAPVVTITRGGHVPWTLGSIDWLLPMMDLALLPVLPDAWNDAKNANRLLKCLALGLPALASDTHAHRQMIREFDLPDILLIDGDGPAWERRIAAIGADYDRIAAAVRAAAPVVRSRYGADRIAEEWLDAVVTAATGAPQSPGHPPECLDLDVLVIGDLLPDGVKDTIDSLGDLSDFKTVTVVAPDRISSRVACDWRSAPDLFGLYPLAARTMAEGTGGATLVLRAGVTLRPGAFAAIAARQPDQILVFPLQHDVAPTGWADPPPTDLPSLLTHPWMPLAAVFPRMPDGPPGPVPVFGHLGFWEHAIRLVSRHGASMAAATDPLALCPGHLPSLLPTKVSAQLTRERSESLARNLPNPEIEQTRLDITLASAIIAAHSEVFGRYASTIIPALWVGARRHGGNLPGGSQRVMPMELAR